MRGGMRGGTPYKKFYCAVLGFLWGSGGKGVKRVRLQVAISRVSGLQIAAQSCCNQPWVEVAISRE